MPPTSMPKFRPTVFRQCVVALLAACTLSACSPKFNWREVQNEAGLYAITMPSKPTSFSRDIDLNGSKTSMTMTATEVDKNTFAVGTAELPDATTAQISLNAMKLALVRNINGTITSEKVVTMPQSQQADAGKLAVTEIEASGPASPATDGQPRLLFARFIAKDKRVYQVLVTGPAQELKRNNVDTFLSSFRLN